MKIQLQCSQCQEHWMHVGDEKTPQERRKWVCPKCSGKLNKEHDNQKNTTPDKP